MQTSFSPEQLAQPETAESAAAIRACVRCGFCTATCPTYVLLGDERDSPRGRIYLMKQMLEAGGPPAAETVRHVDRCLSCLSCRTTCPSGVDYMRLVDHARAFIETHHRRPLHERLLRATLGFILPRPRAFRAALRLAALGRPFRRLLPGRLRSMAGMAPARLPSPAATDNPGVFPPAGETRMRVALLAGCAQTVLDPGINAAAIRLLNRLGCEVVVARGAGCCGALSLHMGHPQPARSFAQANVAAWTRELAGKGLDAVVVTASGCGTSVKDYDHLLRDDPEWAAPAARIAAMTRDISELVAGLGPLPASRVVGGLRVAYHSACSLQHGQGVRGTPQALLRACGFEVVEPREPHICCGSAGVYNLLQPALAARLRDRKAANLAATRPDVVAAGNIGCLVQLSDSATAPTVHTVELLDWATGGPRPPALDQAARRWSRPSTI